MSSVALVPKFGSGTVRSTRDSYFRHKAPSLDGRPESHPILWVWTAGVCVRLPRNLCIGASDEDKAPRICHNVADGAHEAGQAFSRTGP